jgi:hypothetical protein
MSARVTLDFDTEADLQRVTQWVLLALSVSPPAFIDATLTEIHASVE